MRFHWTASRMHSANYCTMKWYLETVEKVQVPRHSYFAKGDCIHRLAENFWNWNRGEVGKDKKKYGVPGERKKEQFIEYAKNMWKGELGKNERSKRPIVFRETENPWVFVGEIAAVAAVLYDMLIQEPEPVKTEYKYNFKLYHKLHVGDEDEEIEARFVGKIDAIRVVNGRPIVQDYKSGLNYMGDMTLGFDPQPTLYCLALSALSAKSNEFAKMIGLEDEAEQLLQPGHFLSRNITFEYILIKTNWKDEEVKAVIEKKQTTRQDKHYFDLLERMIKIEEQFERGMIKPEWQKKCDYCPISEQCVVFNNNAGKEKQAVFDFARVTPLEKIVTASALMPFKPRRQRRFDWKSARKKAEKAAFSAVAKSQE